MRHSRLSVFLVAFLFGSAAIAGAGESSRHAFVFRNAGNPYGEKEMAGFRDAVEEQGGVAILRAPDLPTAEAQLMILEDLIAQRVASVTVVAADPDALQPVLRKASRHGVKVLSADSAVNAASRHLHVNQADPERIGRILVEAAWEMAGGRGDIAVLSANSQATNQNTWIGWMRDELEKPKYREIRLVKVAYGDDLNDKASSEAEALLKSFPDLKVIVAPTTVGIAAAGKVLTDKGLSGKVALTGLGLPSEMAEYIDNGVCPWMFLWNPIDVGYLSGYAAVALADGKIAGGAGEELECGRLGRRVVVPDGDGVQILLGDPFRFDASNIGEWKTVY